MNAAGPVHLSCEAVPALLLVAPPVSQWMSDAERERLATLQSPARRDQFVASRWQARQLLAQALGGAPQDWLLAAPRDAPPRVLADPTLCMSVSHSQGWSACAVARAPLGVDLEVPQPRRDLAGLAALCCTPAEQSMLADLPPADRADRFYALWTVKEAWLKRRLEGVAPRRLAQLDASLVADGEVRTWSTVHWRAALCTAATPVRWWTREPPTQRAWAVTDASAGPA